MARRSGRQAEVGGDLGGVDAVGAAGEDEHRLAVASKSRLFAIAPTSQPSASAASAAVCTESGSTTIRPVPPACCQRRPEAGDGGVLVRVSCHGAALLVDPGLTGGPGARCTLVSFEHVFERLGGGDLDPHPRRALSHPGGTTVASEVPCDQGSGRGRDVRCRADWLIATAEGEMRRYDDPVEVRKGLVPGAGGPVEGPEQFLWRGRLWKVCDVVAHWVETGPWWQSPQVAAVLGRTTPDEDRSGRASVHDLLAEREVWRVEAARGLAATGGRAAGSSTWSSTGPRAAGC